MNYPTIAEVLKMPGQTNLVGLVGRVDKVFKQRNVSGGKTVQDLMLVSAGSEIKIAAWDHPDCSVYEGKEVIIQQGPKGGLTLKDDNYKGNISKVVWMSSKCTFQLVEVHRAMGGSVSNAATNAHPAAAPHAPVTGFHGAKVGMAINNAVLFMTNAKIPFNPAELHCIAGEIIKVSEKLERGEFLEGKPEASEQSPF